MKNTLILFMSCAVLASTTSFITKTKTIRYLPLGDSYTICTGATEKESWPVNLTAHLNENKLNATLLDNPSRNGFSSQDLINNELPLVKQLKPDFVTLLIGVNDWVRLVPKATFSKNLAFILNEVELSLENKKNIVLITIPDFGVTPNGKSYSGGRDISKGIAEFNDVIKQEGKNRGLPVVDIFELSKEMGRDASLVARDGLHPSAKEYAVWEKMILAESLKLLN